MSFALTMLGMALGVVVVLVSNPIQVVPRFLRPVTYASAARAYRRVQADNRIKPGSWTLTVAAAGVLLTLFLVSMLAPVPGWLLPGRILLGLAVGLTLSGRLLRRQEVLIGSLGVIGLYSNPRLVVGWSGLSGYLIDRRHAVVLLLDQTGVPVEALLYSDLHDLLELQLALRPYLSEQTRFTASPQPLRTRWRLFGGFALLGLSVAPLLWAADLPLAGGPGVSQSLFPAILLALLLPLAVFDWSLRLRLTDAAARDYLQVVQFTSRCLRCHYQSICWRAGLHRMLRWQSGRGLVAPGFQVFRRRYRGTAELTLEVFQACSQCLLAHLQEQDIYQVSLQPLVRKKRA